MLDWLQNYSSLHQPAQVSLPSRTGCRVFVYLVTLLPAIYFSSNNVVSEKNFKNFLKFLSGQEKHLLEPFIWFCIIISDSGEIQLTLRQTLFKFNYCWKKVENSKIFNITLLDKAIGLRILKYQYFCEILSFLTADIVTAWVFFVPTCHHIKYFNTETNKQDDTVTPRSLLLPRHHFSNETQLCRLSRVEYCRAETKIQDYIPRTYGFSFGYRYPQHDEYSTNRYH